MMPAARMMSGNGTPKKEDRDEGRGGDGQHHIVLQRTLADALDRVQHDRQHRRLEAEEQRLQ